MIGTIDLDGFKRFLAPHCRPDIGLDELGVSYLKLRAAGPVVATLEAPLSGGGIVVLSARWADPVKGLKIERRLNDGSSCAGDDQPQGSRSLALLNRPAIFAAELGVLFTAFPTDRRLPGLPAANDTRYMRPRLEAALTPMTGGARLSSVEVDPVRYRPEGKCVLRYRMHWQDERPGLPTVLFGKVAKPAIFKRSTAVGPAIATIGVNTPFRVPLVAATLDDLGLELATAVHGASLTETILSTPAPAYGAVVGRALRALHDLPLNLPTQTTKHDRVGLLEDNVAQLARYRPIEAARSAAIGAEIGWRLLRTPPTALVPTHHDFHGHNVLVDHTTDQPTLGLIDFEDLASGEGIDDVASMYTHLTELALSGPGVAENVLGERRAFMDGYGMDERVEPFPTWAALHCLYRAYQILRYPPPAGGDPTDRLLGACERLLSGATP